MAYGCSARARPEFAEQPLLAFAQLINHAAHLLGFAAEPFDLSAEFAHDTGLELGRSFARWSAGHSGHSFARRSGGHRSLADLRRKFANEPFDLLGDLFGLVGQARRTQVLHRRAEMPKLHPQVGWHTGPLAFPRAGQPAMQFLDFARKPLGLFVLAGLAQFLHLANHRSKPLARFRPLSLGRSRTFALARSTEPCPQLHHLALKLLSSVDPAGRAKFADLLGQGLKTLDSLPRRSAASAHLCFKPLELALDLLEFPL